MVDSVFYYLPERKTTTLATVGGIDASQTTGIKLTSVANVVTSKPGIIAMNWSNPIDDTKIEYITYTSIDGSQELVGVTRGAEDSTGRIHSNGVTVAFVVSKSHVDEVAKALNGTNSGVTLTSPVINTPTGDVATLTGTQTLTNKILTSPVFNTGVSGTAISTSATLAENSDTILASQKAVKTYVSNNGAPADGWIAATGTWTYASASTITVPSGAASIYQIGDKIKWTQTTVKYGVIVAVADTLLTIAVNTDYTVANAAISANYYSHQANPIGFPSLFAFTSTITGFTTSTTTLYYSLSGRMAYIYMYNFGGTSNASTFNCTQPFIPATFGGQSLYYQAGLGVNDNSAWKVTSGVCGIQISDGLLKFGIDATTFAANAFGGFTASGFKAVQGIVSFPF